MLTMLFTFNFCFLSKNAHKIQIGRYDQYIGDCNQKH